MKKTNYNMIAWGVLLLIMGLIEAGNIGDYWNVDILFYLFQKGFWTMFIIAPCIVNITQKGLKVPYITAIVVSSTIFAAKMGVFAPSQTKRLVLPMMLTIIGISFFAHFFSPEEDDTDDDQEVAPSSKKTIANYSGLFGTRAVNYDDKLFTGANLSSTLGEVRLDLANAIFPEEPIIINCTATFFGNVDIRLPEFSRVVLKKTSFLGGVHNYKQGLPVPEEDVPIFYIEVTSILGGIDIR